jgi:hypothetical protein
LRAQAHLVLSPCTKHIQFSCQSRKVVAEERIWPNEGIFGDRSG